MTNPPGAMPPLPEPIVLAWLEERRDNCRRIATAKTGPDAKGWIEDAGLFEAAHTLIARVAELQRQNEAQKDEWLSWDSKRAALEKDAARYQWLKERLLAADFAWGEPATCVWVFETDAPISADLDASIDAAIAAKD